jgi:hypothetical protein
MSFCHDNKTVTTRIILIYMELLTGTPIANKYTFQVRHKTIITEDITVAGANREPGLRLTDGGQQPEAMDSCFN